MKNDDQVLLEQAYLKTQEYKINNESNELEIIFHARYNGWTISNNDEGLEDKLAQYGLTFYDEDGDINDYPSKEDVSIIVNKHYNKPTNFKYIVNETDS